MEIITDEPQKPKSGRDQRNKGAKMDPSLWIIVPMENPSDKWKITDGNKNVADMFDTKDDALQFKKWLEWSVITGHGNSQSESNIALKYVAKAGGQVAKKFTKPDFSVHDGKDRNSIYEDHRIFSATNAQLALYVHPKFGKKDQIVIKALSGEHGSKPTTRGRCYCVGLEVDPKGETKFYLAKETDHPTTPRMEGQRKIAFVGKLPDLNDKTFGMRVNHYVDKNGNTIGELDVDLSVLDTPIDQLEEAPNKWQNGFTFLDDGKWHKGTNQITENSGVTYGGDKLGFYVRMDEVGKGDCQCNFCQAVEIEPPN
ncbi:hypothetical protein [Candidatus Nitrosocosmicus sp. SS]|jgi:hypothetical protein|uniref:hypothetical protein n=1 Tax=Candidatus Nitrosocosmicus agrestis TaxID=2563600 RepID=UPI00122DE2E4|nr:hypothetical protein [Candidatus Nitrosocosmicus sp. SS]KAA2280477.1 hypothetical protein F1Z66_10795 [Candidatus Nitrosocosmicus sp. SS]KAF0869256.1 hypothetical protein E5N71_06000 [Candidatus Nitrosocosmicus sp. SS]